MKSAFDTSGPSLWAIDKKMNMIIAAKVNGTKRREQLEKTEPYIEYKAVPRKPLRKIYG
jgi:hypothetical protein